MEEGKKGSPSFLPLPTTHSNFQWSLSSRQDPREGLLALFQYPWRRAKAKGPMPHNLPWVPQNLSPSLSICSNFS